MAPRVAFDKLSKADLTVGTVYKGGEHRTMQAEPMHKLLPGIGNVVARRSGPPGASP